jgi:diamine N-acetyltransferase
VSIQVRFAAPADYPSFLRVARETLEYHVALLPDVFRVADSAFPEPYFRELLGDTNADVIVAADGGEIVGYAIMHLRHAELSLHVPRTVAYIGNFGVLAAYRHRGIGRLIFEKCSRRAKERGVQSLELDCWEANQEALRFYAALGMRNQRRRLAMDL